ncbi:MAG TPA: erythromycin esterase family protein [Sphingobacteriaceae bacterium]
MVKGRAQHENKHHINTARDLDPLLERIGDAKFVLLGEASHGTHEYYTWRTAISKRLIHEKGFSFIAVEGDWPDCYRINRYIKGLDDQEKQPVDLLRTFNRWPTWMWANWEITALVSWLKEHNGGVSADRKVGFYGLDVYSLWESMEVLVNYLEKNDPAAAETARKAYNCFEPFGEDQHSFARAKHYAPDLCKDEVIRLLKEMRIKSRYYDHDPEAALNTEQNALIAANAESYYRSMTSFNDNSWNIRDTHMAETLGRLMKFHRPEAKAIIWEHNTHIGDARFTDMKRAGMVNVGQLVREQYDDKNVVLVGFGSYSGSVIAGKAWGAPMQEMNVPPARSGSVEDILHSESDRNRLLIFDRNENDRYNDTLSHRAIGVVYNPSQEKYGNYVPSVMNWRYDAFIFLDETQALNPLSVHPDAFKVPETYPFEV